MYEYDILATIILFSKKNGGRKELPPITDSEYTYRPVFRLVNEKEGYCCGIVIGNYIENYQFDSELQNIRILFLQFQKIKMNFSPGKTFKLYEGNVVIGTGKITKIRD